MTHLERLLVMFTVNESRLGFAGGVAMLLVLANAQAARADEALNLNCAVSDATSYDQRNPISSINVKVSDGDWTVIHHAQTGVNYNRADQYRVQNMTDGLEPGELGWIGQGYRKPSTYMMGKVSQLPSGAWQYQEIIIDKNQNNAATFTMKSVCQTANASDDRPQPAPLPYNPYNRPASTPPVANPTPPAGPVMKTTLTFRGKCQRLIIDGDDDTSACVSLMKNLSVPGEAATVFMFGAQDGQLFLFYGSKPGEVRNGTLYQPIGSVTVTKKDEPGKPRAADLKIDVSGTCIFPNPSAAGTVLCDAKSTSGSSYSAHFQTDGSNPGVEKNPLK